MTGIDGHLRRAGAGGRRGDGERAHRAGRDHRRHRGGAQAGPDPSRWRSGSRRRPALPTRGRARDRARGARRRRGRSMPPTPTGAVCGFGPVLYIDGQAGRDPGDRHDGRRRQRQSARARGVRQGDRRPRRIDLGGRRAPAARRADRGVRGDRVAGGRVEGARGRCPSRRQVEVDRWGGAGAYRGGRAGEEALLSVPENFNDGWVAEVDGDGSTPLRVDGWQQGWVLPAGEQVDRRAALPPAGDVRRDPAVRPGRERTRSCSARSRSRWSASSPGCAGDARTRLPTSSGRQSNQRTVWCGPSRSAPRWCCSGRSRRSASSQERWAAGLSTAVVSIGGGLIVLSGAARRARETGGVRAPGRHRRRARRRAAGRPGARAAAAPYGRAPACGRGHEHEARGVVPRARPRSA